MTITRRPAPPLFSQLDVSSGTHSQSALSPREEQAELLREMLAAQDRTNELLEDLANTVAATHKQRANELSQWRSAHPALASACREAAEALTRVQIEFLDRMTEEINDTSDDMVEGEFMLNEFVDRYGPRLAHLNGVIQVLAQLSSVPNPANSQHG
jgi:aminoglycoside phosphotransferase family enzyme